MKRMVTIGLNVLIGVISIVSWMWMAFFGQHGAALVDVGMKSLKYFTVLSNLLNGVVCLAYGRWLWNGILITPSRKTLKMIGTSSVGLTFMTVVVFLGPLYGYDKMVQGANLWLHVILPLTSFFSYVFLEKGTRMTFMQTLWAMVPPGTYGAVYVLNNLINGNGHGAGTNDWYSFYLWGNGAAAFIACAVVVGAWGIGLFLSFVGQALPKK